MRNVALLGWIRSIYLVAGRVAYTPNHWHILHYLILYLLALEIRPREGRFILLFNISQNEPKAKGVAMKSQLRV